MLLFSSEFKLYESNYLFCFKSFHETVKSESSFMAVEYLFANKPQRGSEKGIVYSNLSNLKQLTGNLSVK